ncbi:TolC family protein [uncultured Desulfuromonas sp.]|uniref:TolC family protein n=1 Tax=uncultured Desulfuromonas sp. TaxID=181013 RepID=UPI002AAABC0C|nr:TolC family protein [uncultured Desulfuromonas sp.]
MRHAFVLCCLLLLPGTALAETLTLSAAVQRGLERNNSHLAAAADAAAARSAADLAASYQLPQLTFSENLVWTDEPGTSLFLSVNQERLQLRSDADYYNNAATRSDFQSRLQLRQSLYDPNIRFSKLAADKQAQAAAMGVQASGEQLALNILTAYLQIQLAQAQRDWATVGLSESRELLRLAQEREQAGTGLKAERLRAEAQVAQSQQQQMAAAHGVEMAQWQLALQVGADQPVAISAPLSADQLPEPPPATDALRPDLSALELQVEAAELNSRKAAANWQPQLAAGASYTLHDRDYPFSDGADSWLVNAQLNWVLFDGFGRSHERAKARAEERSLRNRQRQALRQARMDQETARLQTATLRRQLVAVRAALAATEESSRLLRQRYRAGLSPLADLLRLQSQLEQHRAELAQSETRLVLSLGEQLFLQGRLLTTLHPEKGE